MTIYYKKRVIVFTETKWRMSNQLQKDQEQRASDRSTVWLCWIQQTNCSESEHYIRQFILRLFLCCNNVVLPAVGILETTETVAPGPGDIGLF